MACSDARQPLLAAAVRAPACLTLARRGATGEDGSVIRATAINFELRAR